MTRQCDTRRTSSLRLTQFYEARARIGASQNDRVADRKPSVRRKRAALAFNANANTSRYTPRLQHSSARNGLNEARRAREPAAGPLHR